MNNNDKRVATEIVNKLRKNGFEAVFAGGCVRDILLGEVPKDYDVVTNAMPEQVENIFSGCTVPVGKQFGVVLVVCDERIVEVATFRKDGVYEDGRHPDGVFYLTKGTPDAEGRLSDLMEQDSCRRDFTINAMFMDPDTGQIWDFHCGQNHIKNKTLKFVGNPADRLREDALRAVRFVRFLGRLNGFKADPMGRSHAKKIIKMGLPGVSAERLSKEIIGMVTATDIRRMMNVMDDCDFLAEYLPEVNVLGQVEQDIEWHPERFCFEHTIRVMNGVSYEDPILRLAALFHDVGKTLTTTMVDGRLVSRGHAEVGAKMTEARLRDFKMPMSIIEPVVWLVANHMKPLAWHHMKRSTLRLMMSEKEFPRLLALYKADKLGSNGDLETYYGLERAYKEHLILGAMPKPIISGTDLKNLGLNGKDIGVAKTTLYEQQLEGMFDTYEAGMVAAQALIANRSFETQKSGDAVMCSHIVNNLHRKEVRG